MPELQRLDAGHEAAVLAFELDNRAWFAASISDRGDELFARFAEHHAAELADQQSGECAYFVLVDDDGSIMGRFNLRGIEGDSALLGYRVARRHAGRGVATSEANAASRRVLAKAGFAA